MVSLKIEPFDKDKKVAATIFCLTSSACFECIQASHVRDKLFFFFFLLVTFPTIPVGCIHVAVTIKGLI